MDANSTKRFTKGVVFVLFSQAFSIFVSFVIGFIVPKFIDEYQYAYWQSFVLYYGYVAIANFGMLDGFILRYSQYDYDELDKSKVRAFFKTLMGWVTLVALIGVFVSFLFLKAEYRWVGILVSCGIVVRHFWAYNYDIFQTTNRMNLYAKHTFIQRAVYVLAIISLIILDINSFVWYCLAELLGEIVAAVLSIRFNRGLFFGKSISIKENIKETQLNVSAGVMLLIANLAANFIVGGAKIIIQSRWGTLVFGKVSFSFSVTNIFLSFVTAISIVLFPSLKRTRVDALPDLYHKINGMITPILFVAMIGYFPLCKILQLWLPKYNDSLVYLGILLPIIMYSATVSLLTNNYLKTFRMERRMLAINVSMVVISLLICFTSAYLFDSLNLLLYGVVFSVMLRSFISEFVVMKEIKRKLGKTIIEKIILTLVFILSVQYLNLWHGCIIYTFAIIIYLLINRDNVIEIIKTVQKVLS